MQGAVQGAVQTAVAKSGQGAVQGAVQKVPRIEAGYLLNKGIEQGY